MRHRKKMWIVIAIAMIIVGAITIVLVRGFSGEDDWTCKDGEWQKHGNPSSSAPRELCPIK